MIAHYDIEQRSFEWAQLKWAKIGGTLSKGLFVKSDTLLIDILSQLTEPFQWEETYVNYDMQRGLDLEPYAITELEQREFIKFKQCGWIQSVKYPLLGISPDGISECETIQCEIKSPARKRHTEILLENKIPNEYIHQMLHAFTVNPKLERHFFVSYRPEHTIRPVFIKELTRDSKVDLGITEKVKIKSDKGKGVKEYVETIPVIKTVSEWVEVSKIEAFRLQNEINQKLELLRV